MSCQQVTFGEPERVRSREYCTASDGSKWVRRIRSDGTRTEWKQYTIEEMAPAQAAPRICLWLVRQIQSAGPYHWSLAIAGEHGGEGQLYQVKGDAVSMHYLHSANVNVFTSNSYYDSYSLAYLDDNGPAKVDYVANSQPPP
ncbi:hypothetical protein GGS24DRAFT_507351 [Hypoxylon argillaceum]|nr:hypothetical protein GGS24DRAFT_507351 [Hypoxylon argillaceum]